jgi:hypothetical protein
LYHTKHVSKHLEAIEDQTRNSLQFFREPKTKITKFFYPI